MSDFDSFHSFSQNFSEELPQGTPIRLLPVQEPQNPTPPRNQSPKVTKKKSKPIKKEGKRENNHNKKSNQGSPKQSKKGKAKRRKDTQHEAVNGRPTNQHPQKIHLKENRSFNDIIYHYSRFMILLKIKQGNDRDRHALQLTNQQSKWMSDARDIMAVHNFPSFEEEKPLFLLHPNSVHFVIQYRITRERKQYYSSEEMKFILLALLDKKEMLTVEIYNYLCEYWEDIVYLANNPHGQEMPNDHPLDEQDVSAEPEDMPSNQEEQVVNNENINDNAGKKKRQVGPSEIDLMRRQLANDQTCIAYEIACYFHACYEKFHIRIRN